VVAVLEAQPLQRRLRLARTEVLAAAAVILLSPPQLSAERADRAQAVKEMLAALVWGPAKLKAAAAAGQVLLAATEPGPRAALAVQEPRPLSQGRL